jgi:hypothetical protein
MSSIEIKNITTNPESSVDDLHGAVDQVSLMHSGQIDPGEDSTPSDHFIDIIKHPNSTADHVSKIVSLPDINPGKYGDHSHLISQAASSGKLTSTLAERFLSENKEEDRYNGYIDSLSAMPGISKDVLKGLVVRDIFSERYSIPDYHKGLTASDMHSVYETAKNQNTTSNERFDENNSRLNEWFHDNIGDVPSSPEDNKKTIKMIQEGLSDSGSYVSRNPMRVEHFAKKNDTLDSSDIETLYNSMKGDRLSYTDSLIAHKNMPPALVSREIRGPDGDIRRQMARYAKITDDDLRSVIASNDTDTLHDIAIYNDRLQPEQIAELYGFLKNTPQSRGKDYAVNDLICNKECPANLIEEYWQSGPKNADATTTMIRKVKNLPKSVLTDIITKNKNIPLSVEALKHKNVDKDILTLAMKRKAADVQSAAANHPLIIKDTLADRIKTNAISPVSVFTSREIRESMPDGRIDNGTCGLILDQIKQSDPHEYLDTDIRALAYMASGKLSSPSDEIQEESLSLLANHAMTDEMSRDKLREIGNLSDVKPNIQKDAQLAYMKAGGTFIHVFLDGNSPIPEVVQTIFNNADNYDQSLTLKNKAINTGCIDTPTFMDFMKSGGMSFNDQDVFDNQFKNLDLEEKTNAYNQVLDFYKNPSDAALTMGSHKRALCFMAASKAPQEVLERAFNEAHPEDKDDFISFMSSENKLPKDMVTYLIHNTSDLSRSARKQINRITIDNRDHTDSLLSYLLDPTKYPDGNLSEETNSKDFPYFGNFNLDNHNTKHFFKSVFGQTDNYDDISDFALTTLSDKIEKLYYNSKTQEAGHLRSILESIPNNDKQKSVYTQLVKNIGSSIPKGQLDWMSGSPADYDGELTKLLFKEGYLSQAKSDEVTQNDPGLAFEALGSMHFDKSHEFMQNFYANAPEANYHIAKTIQANLPVKAIVRPNKSGLEEIFSAKNPEWHQHSTDQLKNHIRYQMLSGNLDGMSAIPEMVSAGIFNEKNKTIAKKAIQQIYDDISTMPINPHNMTRAKVRLTELLLDHRRYGDDFLPKPMLDDYIKTLTNQLDISKLIETSDILARHNNGKTPASLAKALGGFINDIQDLDPIDQESLLKWVDNGDYPLSQLKKIHNTLLGKAVTPEQKHQAASVVFRSASNIIRNAKSEEKCGYAIDLCTRAVKDPEISPNHRLMANDTLIKALSSSDKTSDKHKLQAFLAMDNINPKENPDYHYVLPDTLPEAIGESNEAFAAATHGIKLQLMAKYGMKSLEEDKVSALLDRIHANQEGLDIKNNECISLLLDNKNRIGEAVAQKAINTIGQDYAIEYDTKFQRNPLDKKSPLAKALVDKTIEKTKAFMSSPDTSLASKMDTINRQISKVSADSYPEHLGSLIDSSSYILKSALAQTEIGSEQITAQNISTISSRMGEMLNRVLGQNKNSKKPISDIKLLEMANDLDQWSETQEEKFKRNYLETAWSPRINSHFFETLKPGIDVNRIYELCPTAYRYYHVVPRLTAEMINKVPLNMESHDFDGLVYPVMHHWVKKMNPETFSKSFMPKLRTFYERTGSLTNRYTNDLLDSIAKHQSNSLTEDDVNFLSARNFPENEHLDKYQQKNNNTDTIRLMGGRNISLQFVRQKLEKGLSEAHTDGVNFFIARTPHVNEIFDQFNEYSKKEGRNFAVNIIQNNELSGQNIDKILKLSDNEPNTVRAAMRRSNINEETLNTLMGDTKDSYQFFKDPVWRAGTEVHPVFTNMTYGHRIFLDESKGFPISPEIPITPSPDNLVFTAEHSKERDAIREALSKIPPEGISFADYKKINPKNAETNVIKGIFMAAKKQTITPEDLSREMKNHDGDYSVTYSQWSGLQTHRNATNLVIQMNTGVGMNEAMKKDPQAFAFFQLMQKAIHLTPSTNSVSNHPVTPFCVSWARVDTSAGDKGWIIEETQSDFDRRLDQFIHILTEKGTTDMQIDGHTVTVEDLPKYKKRLEKIIEGWHEATIKATVNLAKKNGIKNLYLHGLGVRHTLIDPSSDPSVTLQYMYDKWPRKNGLEEVDYQDYPAKSQSFYNMVRKNKLSTKCWKFKL